MKFCYENSVKVFRSILKCREDGLNYLMKIVQINGGVFGSTGNIMFGITGQAEKRNYETMCFSPITVTNRYQQPNYEYQRIGSFRSRQLNVLIDRITGLSGCSAFFSTMKMLRKIRKFNPDVIHLHNLHNSFVNLPMLFSYIKKHNIKTVWTLHDCWAFTGHCPHFDMIGCDKWKNGCFKCPQYREYPKSLRDNSQYMYKLKRKWFTGIMNMTIVTPSVWLAGLVEQSFLGIYPVKVINNGIDLNNFCPTESEFRYKYGIINKHIILGVAFGWSDKKGLDVFIELEKRLDNSLYQIVLVGTDDMIKKQLPDNIIAINRTQDKKEMAEIYSAADVFVNPTREDTYPTVNMEAIACGTPVVTFRTGGSPECIDDIVGSVVEKNDIDALEKEIVRICEEKLGYSSACEKEAERFNEVLRFQEYIDLVYAKA